MRTAISLCAGTAIVAAVAFLVTSRPAEASAFAAYPCWPPPPQDIANLDSLNSSAPGTTIAFDNAGFHQVTKVPNNRYLVVTNFEVWLVDGFGNRMSSSLVAGRTDLSGQVTVLSVKRNHVLNGSDGDTEVCDVECHGNPTWPGPHRSSAVGLVFDPGTEVHLQKTSPTSPVLGGYNLVGYYVDV